MHRVTETAPTECRRAAGVLWGGSVGAGGNGFEGMGRSPLLSKTAVQWILEVGF